jgi:hypothetical protein
LGQFGDHIKIAQKYKFYPQKNAFLTSTKIQPPLSQIIQKWLHSFYPQNTKEPPNIIKKPPKNASREVFLSLVIFFVLSEGFFVFFGGKNTFFKGNFNFILFFGCIF